MGVTARRRHQSGFTLIELLVVIAILGILSGVVVFAVRGAGNKGRANAIATDNRIVRTALEAYCAQNGHYPQGPDGTGPQGTMDVLVSEKYLASQSTYTSLTTGNDPAAYPEGVCGDGTTGPMHYKLDTVDPIVATTTTTSAVKCPLSDTFCNLGYNPTTPMLSLAPLPSGKVLGFTSDRAIEYDPTSTAGNPYGKWGNEAVYPLDGEILPGSLVIGSRPSPDDDCSPNCSKVLVHNKTTWLLYDPTTTTWLPVPSQSDPAQTRALASGGGSGGNTAQVLGRSCGQYCGQVLMVYSAGPNDTGGPFAELWNPKTAAFTPLGYIVSDAPSDGVSMEVLKDGRVLMTAAGSGTKPKWTRIFNPATFDPAKGFDVGLNHGLQHAGGHAGAVFATGEVLFIDAASRSAAELFNGSSWATASSCGSAASDFCDILTAFDSGNKVLAISTPRDQPYGTSVKTAWRFDSTKPVPGWEKTRGAPNGTNSVRNAAVIDGPKCTNRCGQVITAGGANDATRGSELFIPPTK